MENHLNKWNNRPLSFKQILALDNAKKHLQYTQKDIIRLEELNPEIYFEKMADYNALVEKIIDNLITFTELLIVLKTQVQNMGPDKIATLEKNLLFILQDILQAKEMNDWIKLTDLFTQELYFNIDEWLNSGIPIIIKLIKRSS